MVNIKKQQVKAYILLESLIAISLLSVIAGVVLVEMSKQRRLIFSQNQQIAALNTAVMAYDKQTSFLAENGVVIRLKRLDKQLIVSDANQEIIRIEILQETP